MAKQTRLRVVQQSRKRKLTVLYVVLLLLMLVAGWKLAQSYGLFEKFRAVFGSTGQMTPRTEAVRGTIYDRNYKDIAVSLEKVSVYARTRELEGTEETARMLAAVLGVDVEHLQQKMEGDSARAWLVKNISQKQEEDIRRLALPGIFLHKEYSRYYPEETTAAHLIGFVEDDIGLAGVEYLFDRLARRAVTEEGRDGYRGSTNQDLVLTLDLKIQEILEGVVQELRSGRQGVTIGAYAMDSGSGALISSVQRPSFNPNTSRLYSREILTSLLLQPMALPAKFRTLLRDAATFQNQFESHGKVLPWSVSSDLPSLGGELRLWDRLGFTRPTPPDFAIDDHHLTPGSKPSFLLAGDGQDYRTTPETLTPLQLLAGLSALVNGGKTVEPFVVDKVVDPQSGEEYMVHGNNGQASLTETIASEVSTEIGQCLLRWASTDELGAVTLADSAAAVLVIDAGRKLMTNQLIFAAVPAEQAELTVLITIQGEAAGPNPKGAADRLDPVATLQAVLPRIAVLQQVGKSVADVVEPEKRQPDNYPVDLTDLRKTIGAQKVQEIPEQVVVKDMPEVVGFSLRKSLRLLQETPCVIRVHGTGMVIRQEPKAGTPLEGVAECVLTLQDTEDVRLEKLEQQAAGGQ